MSSKLWSGTRCSARAQTKIAILTLFLIVCITGYVASDDYAVKRAYVDDSIQKFFSERTCWWNEVCKREFQHQFRCRCPRWSYCRSPGKYYDAYCTITSTGYIWMQTAANSLEGIKNSVGLNLKP